MLTRAKLPTISLLAFRNLNLFCKINNTQKKQILKTYLQVIPPYKLHQILQKDKCDLKNFTNLDRPLCEKQLKDVLKQIKNNGHIIQLQKLMEVMQSVKNVESTSENERKLVKKVQSRIINIFRKKMHFLPLDLLINFVYKIVKLNHKQFQIMKEVERIIIEQKIKINYPQIRKILWAYTHLDAGSSVLYSHVSKTIKIGQHQFAPLELAESAYMLSKVSQNASGGFGVFQIAQKHVQNHLNRLQFHDLVKAASYLLTQNIGSNDFQVKLEEQIYKKYPDRVSLRINQLVDLLKSTATYYFKFKENALLHMLKTSTERLAPHTTLEQFQDIIWSWGRSGKGDRQMWQILQKCITDRFINQLKPRQTAFFYYSLCSSEYSSQDVLRLLEDRFMELLDNKTNEHYLVKMLLGMQKRKDYSNQIFLKLGLLISERIPSLSNKELIAFGKAMNESDIHFQNKDQNIVQIQESLQRVSPVILNKMYMFGPHEIVQLLYLWIKLDIPDKDHKFVDTLLSQLQADLLDIPKAAFIKAMFCFTIRDRYTQAIRMIPILYELMKYGPLGYFFSPFQTPLMAYCIFHIAVNSHGKIKIHPRLISQMQMCLAETKSEMLNEFVRKGYQEALALNKKL